MIESFVIVTPKQSALADGVRCWCNVPAMVGLLPALFDRPSWSPPFKSGLLRRRDSRAACPCWTRARWLGIMSITLPCSIT